VENKGDYTTTKRRINRIEYFSLGYGPVSTVGLYCGFGGKGILKKNGLLQDTNITIAPIVLNWDGIVAPVIHQIDRCGEISSDLDSYADLLWSLWESDSADLI